MDAMDGHRVFGRFVSIALICFVVAGLIGMGQVRRAGASPPTDTLPCSKRKATAAFDSFVAAFNKGDIERLDSLFSLQPDFEWYSSGRPGVRVGRASNNRRTLMSYFTARHARGDRIRVRTFDFNGNSARWSNFGLDLGRRADDYRNGAWFRTGGKGAVACDDGQPKFFVISLGDPAPRVSASLSSEWW